MEVSDADDRGSVIVITIPKTETTTKRVFSVVNDGDSYRCVIITQKIC